MVPSDGISEQSPELRKAFDGTLGAECRMIDESWPTPHSLLEGRTVFAEVMEQTQGRPPPPQSKLAGRDGFCRLSHVPQMLSQVMKCADLTAVGVKVVLQGSGARMGIQGCHCTAIDC
jgi:hypothetical protein